MSTASRRLLDLKTFLKGLARAVLKFQPENIYEFAAAYLNEILQYRDENPSVDINDLVKEYERRNMKGWPDAATASAYKKMAPPLRVVQDVTLLSVILDSKRITPELSGMASRDASVYTPDVEGEEEIFMSGHNNLNSHPLKSEYHADQVHRMPLINGKMVHYHTSNDMVSSHHASSITLPPLPRKKHPEQDDEAQNHCQEQLGPGLHSKLSSRMKTTTANELSTKTSQGFPYIQSSVQADYADRDVPNTDQSSTDLNYQTLHQSFQPVAGYPEKSLTISDRKVGGNYSNVPGLQFKDPSKTLQCDGNFRRVDRIVSKISHHPHASNMKYSDIAAPITSRTDLCFRTASTIPATRVPSQFNLMSDVAKSSERGTKCPTSYPPCKEVNLAVKDQIDGVSHEHVYLPCQESSTHNAKTPSVTHNITEPKIVQAEQPSSYNNFQSDMRAANSYLKVGPMQNNLVCQEQKDKNELEKPLSVIDDSQPRIPST